MHPCADCSAYVQKKMSAPVAEPSRKTALSRLSQFVPRAGARYAKSRNFDFGPDRRTNVSTLSPYLRHRLLLEEEVLQTTLQRHSLAAASKFVQAVFWRTYYKGWLEQRPAVWADYRHSLVRILSELEDRADVRQRYESAVAGNTGIDCFDAWVHELLSTGYLHNHARMWFASIWVFTLELPWQLGADFFYRHLLDGDPASNTLSWRWVSGLHTPGKTYLATAANIAKFTDNRFHPEGLATHAPAPKMPDVYPLRHLPASQSLEASERFGLFITEEDCFPESILGTDAPAAIMGAVATRMRSPLPLSDFAEKFANGAVSDALERSSRIFAVNGELTDSLDWGDTLLEWAKAHDFKTIATAHAPVGPVAELLAEAADKLAQHGIRLLQLRRPYDSLVWPHARRGFFKLKDQIPTLIERLGNDPVPGAITKKAG